MWPRLVHPGGATLVIGYDYSLPPPTQGHHVNHTLLTIPQTAERLQISVPTLRRMLKRGDMPHQSIGRQVRINASDLDAYIDGTRSEPVSDTK